MEEQEAYRILKLEYGAEPHKVKSAYRKMALKLHPDRNGSNTEFGKITNAYNVLKSIPAKPVKKQSSSPQSATRSQRTTRPQNPPEQDWSKYTKEYEQDESFWTEYERKFWENYGKFTDKNKGNAKMQDEDEDEKLDLAVKIEPSLCIGCCSCEVIAPNVFSIDKDKQTNPKSTVHNRHGASFEKIMNAAETCDTKAIQWLILPLKVYQWYNIMPLIWPYHCVSAR